MLTYQTPLISLFFISAIGEELTFEDVNTSSGGEKLGSVRSDKSYVSPGSPNGSIGSSSVVSRGSDTGRSVKSSRSLRSLKERPPPQQGGVDRLTSC